LHSRRNRALAEKNLPRKVYAGSNRPAAGVTVSICAVRTCISCEPYHTRKKEVSVSALSSEGSTSPAPIAAAVPDAAEEAKQASVAATY